MALGVEQMREDAVAAFYAAVAAVQPSALLPKLVRREGDGVLVRGRALPDVRGKRVVMALGKAGPGLADVWLSVLEDWTDDLMVLAPHGTQVPERVRAAATVVFGAHPIPDADGEAATRRLLEAAGDLGAHDLLVVLLSGGASALLAAPREGLEVEHVRTTTRLLLEAGAPIRALNTVRRQLLAAAGGGLAAAAAPAQVVTLVLSDVLGDSLPDIASGPTVPSPTGPEEALAVLEQFGARVRAPAAVTSCLRRQARAPATTPLVSGRVEILGNNRTAVDATAAALDSRGYRVVVHGGHLTGEARDRGRELGALAKAMSPPGPTAFVAGGETTVTVRGPGRGGRSQELALAASLRLAGGPPRVLLAAGTDGVDGSSEAAGAVVDPGSVQRMSAAGVDPRAALTANDSGTALAAAGDTIKIGPTGTNVCDVVLLLATTAD